MWWLVFGIFQILTGPEAQAINRRDQEEQINTIAEKHLAYDSRFQLMQNEDQVVKCVVQTV